MSKKNKELKDYILSEVLKIELPKDWNKFLQHRVFNNEYIMFVKNESKIKHGCCQHCKNENIPLSKNVRIGQTIKCPICKHDVKLRNLKYKKYYSLNTYVSYFRKIAKGYLLLNYRVIKFYNYFEVDYTSELLECCYIKDFFADNVDWFHIVFKYSDGRWIQCLENNCYKSYYFEIPLCNMLYTNNLSYLNNLDGCKYMPLIQYAREYPCNPYLFILKYLNNSNIIEKIIKSGLSSVLVGILGKFGKCIGSDFKDSNNIKEILNIKRSDTLRFAIQNKVNLFELYCLRWLEKNNYPLTKENLKCATLFLDVSKEYQDEILECMSFISFSNYLNSQNESKHFVNDYVDYLYYAKKLNYDLKDTKYLKPKNFKVAHDMAVKKYRSIKSMLLYSSVKKALKSYSKLKYIGKKYSVICPSCAEDIIQEGEDMNNCVGGYLDRVANGNSYILFVRHTNDITHSFYTLELNPKDLKIVQCRGYNNDPTPEERAVQRFVKEWRENIVLKKMKVV